MGKLQPNETTTLEVAVAAIRGAISNSKSEHDEARSGGGGKGERISSVESPPLAPAKRRKETSAQTMGGIARCDGKKRYNWGDGGIIRKPLIKPMNATVWSCCEVAKGKMTIH